MRADKEFLGDLLLGVVFHEEVQDLPLALMPGPMTDVAVYRSPLTSAVNVKSPDAESDSEEPVSQPVRLPASIRPSRGRINRRIRRRFEAFILVVGW